MNLTTNLSKLARDFIVTAVGAVLLALGNNAGDFGIPPEYTFMASSAALFLYRLLREKISPPAPSLEDTRGV